MRTVVRSVVSLVVAGALCACGGGGGGVTSDGVASSGTLANYTVGEDGTNSSPWGDGTASDRPAMAVKLTPATYPVTVTSVTIHAYNNTGAVQSFNLHGFSDLSSERELFTPLLDQSIPAGSPFSETTISIPPTVIASGSFYVAVEWVTKPLRSASGANSFFLRTDSHLDHANANFFRFAGTTWSTTESVSTAAGDVGISANYLRN